MIGKLTNNVTNNVTNNEGANAFPVVALQDTITALAAKGPARASIGRILSGLLSNPVPRSGKPAAA